MTQALTNMWLQPKGFLSLDSFQKMSYSLNSHRSSERQSGVLQSEGLKADQLTKNMEDAFLR